MSRKLLTIPARPATKGTSTSTATTRDTERSLLEDLGSENRQLRARLECALRNLKISDWRCEALKRALIQALGPIAGGAVVAAVAGDTPC